MTRWVLLLTFVLACIASARTTPVPAVEAEPGVLDCDSPDGSLRVRISGDSRQAVLVDHVNEQPAWMVLLDRNAVRARFREAAGGEPARLELDLADGKSAVYDLKKLLP